MVANDKKRGWIALDNRSIVGERRIRSIETWMGKNHPDMEPRMVRDTTPRVMSGVVEHNRNAKRSYNSERFA